MAEEKAKNKKQEETGPNAIKNLAHIDNSEYHSPNPLTYKDALSVTGGVYSVGAGAPSIKNYSVDRSLLVTPTADATVYGTKFTGIESQVVFTPQSPILGDNSVFGEKTFALASDHMSFSTESHLVGMKMNTIGDMKNFFVGVNNFASQFASDDGLLTAIKSVSGLNLDNGRLVATGIEGIHGSSVIKGLDVAKAYHLKSNEIFKLSESVTTVLAYGQAVQSQWGTIPSTNEILKTGVGSLIDTSYNPIQIASEVITSPFIFAPQRIETEKIIQTFPKVKEELPVKTAEAIKLMEYMCNPDTKDDDTIITTRVGELKRAMKTIQGVGTMLIQKTTQTLEITAKTITPEKNKFPYKIPAGTTWRNIIIQFTSEDSVNIEVAGHSHQTGYADMGFVDRRAKQPTMQWGLLLLLAKNGGHLSSSSGDARVRYKKHKQLLANRLKEYFSLDYDPFEPYKDGYTTKITLVPPTSEQSKPEDIYSIGGEMDDLVAGLSK